MTLDQTDRPVTVTSDGGEPAESRPPRSAKSRRLGRIALHAAVLLAVAAAGLWAYWANVQPGRPKMDTSMRVTAGATPFPVALATAERRPIAGTVTYTGSVAAFNEEDIYPRVTGRIVEMPVYPGDPVRAGQVVARLDDVELSSRLREAEAMLATAEANRLQMEAELVAARQGILQMEKELAMVDAELAYARAVATRSERLVRTGAISRQEYENDASMAAALEAKREAAGAKLEQMRAMEGAARKKVEAADSMREQSRAAARTAKVVRDYVVIEAPSSGYVVKRLVAPGVLVQPGMALLKIAQIDRVRLQANVGEKDLASIRVGSPVTVTPVGANQRPLTAKVTSVFPFVDQGPRTAIVEATVDNSARRFLPGQYLLMQFSTGDRGDAVTVPRSAVARMGGTSTAWVVKGDRAEPRTITTGLEGPDRVEITQGLAAGERVVVRGREGLYAGARVADVAASKPARPEAPDHKGMPEMGGQGPPKAPSRETPGMPGMPQPTPQPKEGAHGRY
jgi:multidrug efflux pump subunit AcrA (membrane-fusion protein)